MGGFSRTTMPSEVCCITVKHTQRLMLMTRLSFSSKLILKHSYKWFSVVSVRFSHFRWKHRRHAVCVSLPVPGGVPDGACGLGGVASELCDLLQGEGDQLQGESPGRQLSRQTWLHLGPCGPHLMNIELGCSKMEGVCEFSLCCETSQFTSTLDFRCRFRSSRTTSMMRSTSLHRQRTLPLCSPQLRCTPSLCPLCLCLDPHTSNLLPASQVRRIHTHRKTDLWRVKTCTFTLHITYVHIYTGHTCTNNRFITFLNYKIFCCLRFLFSVIVIFRLRKKWFVNIKTIENIWKIGLFLAIGTV